jgi:endonuclease/exonuclease/phosphatase (EEP) superfamily protein YafD
MRHRLTAFLAVLSVAVIGVPLVARADAEPVTVTALSWNVCGEFAACPKVNDPAGKVAQIRSLVQGKGAEVVLLQEICEWQANRLLLDLRSGDSAWNLAFAPLRQIDTAGGYPGRRTRGCDLTRYAAKNGKPALTTTGHAFGQAVFVKGRLDQITSYELEAPTVEQWTFAPQLLCGRLVEKNVRACTTHYTPSGADEGHLRKDQAARTAEIVRSFGTDRVLVSGDLNTVPSLPELNPLYAAMRECEQPADGAHAGAPTAFWTGGSGRIDYLFARSNESNDASLVTDCETPPAGSALLQTSDHLPTIGTFAL